jgi:hypothetical protein
MVVGFCRRCFGSSFAALSALQFAVPLAARQFVVTIAVRSWWLCVSVKAEPGEVHKESGIIRDLTRCGQRLNNRTAFCSLK